MCIRDSTYEQLCPNRPGCTRNETRLHQHTPHPSSRVLARVGDASDAARACAAPARTSRAGPRANTHS
eukprot:271799-Alexandrium_andersonii.AAC.1